MKVKKAQDLQDATMQTVHTLTFTKQELTILYNLLVWQSAQERIPRSYPLSISRLLYPILDKIEPIVVSDTNIKEEVKVS